jgi:hypothetical protein
MGEKRLAQAHRIGIELKLNGNARTVYCEMAYRTLDSDPEPRYWRSREQLAESVGMHAQQVKVAIADLVKRGLLERIVRGAPGRRAMFAVRFPSTEQGTESVPNRVRNRYPMGDQKSTPNDTTEDTREDTNSWGQAELDRYRDPRTAFRDSLSDRITTNDLDAYWKGMQADGIRRPDRFVAALEAKGQLDGYLASNVWGDNERSTR